MLGESAMDSSLSAAQPTGVSNHLRVASPREGWRCAIEDVLRNLIDRPRQTTTLLVLYCARRCSHSLQVPDCAVHPIGASAMETWRGPGPFPLQSRGSLAVQNVEATPPDVFTYSLYHCHVTSPHLNQHRTEASARSPARRVSPSLSLLEAACRYA